MVSGQNLKCSQNRTLGGVRLAIRPDGRLRFLRIVGHGLLRMRRHSSAMRLLIAHADAWQWAFAAEFHGGVIFLHYR